MDEVSRIKFNNYFIKYITHTNDNNIINNDIINTNTEVKRILISILFATDKKWKTLFVSTKDKKCYNYFTKLYNNFCESAAFSKLTRNSITMICEIVLLDDTKLLSSLKPHKIVMEEFLENRKKEPKIKKRINEMSELKSSIKKQLRDIFNTNDTKFIEEHNQKMRIDSPDHHYREEKNQRLKIYELMINDFENDIDIISERIIDSYSGYSAIMRDDLKSRYLLSEIYDGLKLLGYNIKSYEHSGLNEIGDTLSTVVDYDINNSKIYKYSFDRTD